MHSLAEDLTASGPGFVPVTGWRGSAPDGVRRSAEAAALAQQGRKIDPFDLGDLNIPTAEPIVAAMNQAIRDGKTTYCANAGVMPLREALPPTSAPPAASPTRRTTCRYSPAASRSSASGSWPP